MTARKWQRGKSSSWIRQDKRHAIYVRDLCRCVWCGREVDHATATLDHLWPVGHPCRSNDEECLLTCCYECNSSRKAVEPVEWLERLAIGGRNVGDILERMSRRRGALCIEEGRSLLEAFRRARGFQAVSVDLDSAEVPF